MNHSLNALTLLLEDIRFAETPTFVEGIIGSSQLLECQATGQPEPKVSWRFNSRKITQGKITSFLILRDLKNSRH